MTDQLFFVGQKAFIEHDNAVLVLRNPKGRIDFPGGKIQVGETDFVKSLQREVREETSLEIGVGDAFYAWHFTLPPEHKDAGNVVYLVGFRCKLLGGTIAISDEHKSYEWISKAQLSSIDDGSGHFIALRKYFS
jgi:8-oxo-dGTP pyrophosphatase MutT (NUDIX family)